MIRLTIVLLAVGSLVTAHGAAQAQSPGARAPARSDLRAKLAPCQTPGVTDSVLCGRFEVPEVRGAADSRRLALNIVLLPATTDSVLPDPLVFLAGGGVVPATRYASFLSRAFPTLRRQRDILLVDQRGTWNSNPLTCRSDSASGPNPAGPPADDDSCLAALMRRADLRAYSTAIAMDDLDQVREWLGYPTLNLYGVSYGTKAAQVYLKQYPERVRSVVLYGVVPINAATQLDLAAFAQHSLGRVFALCAADPSCHAAFPNLPAAFDSTLARLTRAPAVVSAEGPDGTSHSVPVTDRAFRDLVQVMLSSARTIERLPLLIHEAYGGDYDPVARALLGPGSQAPGPPRPGASRPSGPPPPPPLPAPRGVFLSILCSESIPLIDSTRIASATEGTFFGSAPVLSQIESCARWPRAILPLIFWEPARQAQVPVLAISGDLDPITPPSYAELVTSQLRKNAWSSRYMTAPGSSKPSGAARHLIVPNRSHGDVDPCITGIFEQFIIAGGANGLDTTCTALPAPLKFATTARDIAPSR